MAWTKEKINKLKELELAEKKLTNKQIVKILGDGVTLGAVAGKRYRLKNQANRPIRTKSKPVAVKKLPRRTKNTPPKKQAATKKSGPVKKVETKDVVVEPLLIPLVKLTNNTCRWPIGDPHTESFGFCGHPPKAHSSYCAYHAKKRKDQSQNQLGETRAGRFKPAKKSRFDFYNRA